MVLTTCFISLTLYMYTREGGGILPYIGYSGMCHWKGYGFQAKWSGIGSSNHRKLVYYRVPFNGIAHKRLKSSIFSLV